MGWARLLGRYLFGKLRREREALAQESMRIVEHEKRARKARCQQASDNSRDSIIMLNRMEHRIDQRKRLGRPQETSEWRTI